MSYTTFFRRVSRAGHTMDYPRVAHIVADLDELAIAVGYPRPRRAVPFRRLVAAVQTRFAHRRLTAESARAAIVMAVAP